MCDAIDKIYIYLRRKRNSDTRIRVLCIIYNTVMEKQHHALNIFRVFNNGLRGRQEKHDHSRFISEYKSYVLCANKD